MSHWILHFCRHPVLRPLRHVRSLSNARRHWCILIVSHLKRITHSLCLERRVLKHWNELPVTIFDAKSVSEFKKFPVAYFAALRFIVRIAPEQYAENALDSVMRFRSRVRCNLDGTGLVFRLTSNSHIMSK